MDFKTISNIANSTGIIVFVIAIQLTIFIIDECVMLSNGKFKTL